jgi:hypothetical protein
MQLEPVMLCRNDRAMQMSWRNLPPPSSGHECNKFLQNIGNTLSDYVMPHSGQCSADLVKDMDNFTFTYKP